MRKIIIDCDPGIDDSLAIMLALSIRELEVVGITVVCGNSPAIRPGIRNPGCRPSSSYLLSSRKRSRNGLQAAPSAAL